MFNPNPFVGLNIRSAYCSRTGSGNAPITLPDQHSDTPQPSNVWNLWPGSTAAV